MTWNYPLRRLWSLLASNVSLLRSPTRCRNSTFSKYPPPRLFASSSAASSGSPGAVTCAFQSSADFSRVVSFFPFRESADGSSASWTFGFRRPGRLATTGCALAAEGDDAMGKSAGDGVAAVLPVESSSGVAAASKFSGGFQRGHFFASVESSGTSTISLSSRSPKLIRKVD